MKEFYTAKAHSKPKKLPLSLPNGHKTDHYFMILGLQSESVREAKNRVQKEMLMNGMTKDQGFFIWIASMIESWSFDEDCSEENKIKFLKEAPQVADSVDIFSSNHANFAKK